MIVYSIYYSVNRTSYYSCAAVQLLSDAVMLLALCEAVAERRLLCCLLHALHVHAQTH
jgi:hypothetical protein